MVKVRQSKKSEGLSPDEVSILEKRHDSYYAKLKEGPGEGFHLVLFLDHNAEDEWKILITAVEVFKKTILYAAPYQDLPPFHNHLDNPLLRSGLTLLIGHPIPLAFEQQIVLAKRFVEGWFKAVDIASQQKAKAVASISYGEIIYGRPEVFDLSPGRFTGKTYLEGCLVLRDAMESSQRWPEKPKTHRLALNPEALKILGLPPSLEKYHGSDDKSLVLYGLDWKEGSL